MSRLVSVSNRVTVPRRSVPPGGLALGVHAAMQARGGLWFGWSGEIAEREPDAARIVIRDRIAYGTIELTHADHDQYYLGFCNGAIWPLFHYFLDAVHYHDEQYEGCLSFFDVRGIVSRPLLVEVEHHLPSGERSVSTFRDAMARLVAHEVDHLHGLVYPDRMPGDGRLLPVEEYHDQGRPWHYDHAGE